MMTKNSTLICASIMGQSIDDTLNDISRAKASGADLVEINLDTLKNFSPCQDLKYLINASPLPALFAFRPKWAGGWYGGDESKRLDTLRLAVELGADYVDVELQVAHEFIDFISEKKPDKCKIILASHNYNDTPSVEDLGDLIATIQATGADIVKIATTALDITDVARIFRIIAHSQVPTIGLAMGEKGLISCILCAKFGGFLTYATVDSGVASAPSQSSIKDLLELFNFRNITRDTKVFGLIGKPVSQSKSPFLYNAAFKSVDFNGIYVPFLVDAAAKFLQTYSSPDFAAFSCTLPHKSIAVKCCDEVDPVAESIGAVNLIVRRESDGKLLGFNTDFVGAITAIENGLRGIQNNSNPTTSSPLEGKLFVVMGAGGAGKALAYGAKEKGARVVIANRTFERAKQLAKSVGGEALPLADLHNFHPEEGTILANATPVGMQPNVDDTPLPKQALRHYRLVFDAVYAPKMTRLLKEAQESGATIVTGLEMFIGQAYGHYEGFTGLPAPKELFRKIMSNY